VTDAVQYLFKKGVALPPSMPTLHVASIFGAMSNEIYGPEVNTGPASAKIAKMKIITYVMNEKCRGQ